MGEEQRAADAFEPCAIGGTGAIANAVFNALGIRIPMVPVTSDRVLNALGNKRYA